MRILTYLFFSVMISTLFLPVDYGFSACHFTAATSLLSSTFLKSNDVEAVNSPCVASMQCDSEHCCVVTHEGSATCWGRGGFIGQLGLGPLLNGSNPNWGDEAGEMGSDFPFVDVGKSVTVVQVATGSGHTCALLSDASLKCWGLNAYGQLGQPNTTDLGLGNMGDALPAINLGSGKTALSVSCGWTHTCVLLNDYTVKCFGYNYQGQLGQANMTQTGIQGLLMLGDSLPPINLGFNKTAVAVSCGYTHTCVLLSDYTVKCWGSNGNGELGQGNTTSPLLMLGDSLPPIDLGSGKTALAISCSYHTCVVLDDYTVKCWGANNYGQLGQGYVSSSPNYVVTVGDALPPINLGNGKTALAVSCHIYHTCVLLNDYTVKCFGRNNYGQLGQVYISTTPDYVLSVGDALPPINMGTGKAALAVSCGSEFTCVLLNDYTVKCFGMNDYGQLGQGNTTNLLMLGDSLPPISVCPETHSPTSSPTVDVVDSNSNVIVGAVVGSVVSLMAIFAAFGLYSRKFGNPFKSTQASSAIVNTVVASPVATNNKYVVFFSHYQKEASALECTVFRKALAKRLRIKESSIFLDADELSDLRTLSSTVSTSRVFVLFLTKNVLTRPFCLAEVYTAITNGVPIVPVNLDSKGMEYNYEEAASFLTSANFEGELESRNPGASLSLSNNFKLNARDVGKVIGEHLPNLISAVKYSANDAEKLRNAQMEMFCDRVAIVLKSSRESKKLKTELVSKEINGDVIL